MRKIRDEKGVSPVIGVVMMVAVTVVLAAIVAAFVLGIGTPKTAPDISFTSVKAFDNGTSDYVKFLVLGTALVDNDDLIWQFEDTTTYVEQENIKAGVVVIMPVGDAITVGTTYHVVVIHSPSGKPVYDGYPVGESP